MQKLKMKQVSESTMIIDLSGDNDDISIYKIIAF